MYDQWWLQVLLQDSEGNTVLSMDHFFSSVDEAMNFVEEMGIPETHYVLEEI